GLRLALGLGRTAAGDALTAGLGGGASAAGATAGGLTGPQGLEVIGREAAHDDGDVAGALADAGGAATGTGTPALERRALVGEAGRDEQLVGRDGVVVLGVGDGRLEALEDRASDVALGQLEDLESPSHGQAPDEVED